MRVISARSLIVSPIRFEGAMSPEERGRVLSGEVLMEAKEALNDSNGFVTSRKSVDSYPFACTDVSCCFSDFTVCSMDFYCLVVTAIIPVTIAKLHKIRGLALLWNGLYRCIPFQLVRKTWLADYLRELGFWFWIIVAMVQWLLCHLMPCWHQY